MKALTTSLAKPSVATMTRQVIGARTKYNAGFKKALRSASTAENAASVDQYSAEPWAGESRMWGDISWTTSSTARKFETHWTKNLRAKAVSDPAGSRRARMLDSGRLPSARLYLHSGHLLPRAHHGRHVATAESP